MRTVQEAAEDVQVLRIVGPHLTGAIGVRKSRVVRATPRLRYMRGWSLPRVKEWLEEKGWRFE